MKMSTPQRLVDTRQIVNDWRNAVRNSARGRTGRAAAMLTRVARALRSLGPNAPAGLMRDLTASRAFAHGPALTPALKQPEPRSAVGLALNSPFGSLPVSRRQVESVGHTQAFDLMVDLPRQRVSVRGNDLPLEGRDIPLKMLASLIRAKGGPLTLEELFPQAWGRRFNAAYDSNTVYFHVSRLRKLIAATAPGVEILATCQGAYRLSANLRYALVEEFGPARKASRDRASTLQLIADRKFVDNRGYCEITGVSRSTALRELAELTASGLLVREGAGRGVRYRVAPGHISWSRLPSLGRSRLRQGSARCELS